MIIERYRKYDVERLNSPTVSTLEYYLGWLIDEATIQTEAGSHPYVDSIGPVLDAALEYWLMKHRASRDYHQLYGHAKGPSGWGDIMAWDKVDGWQCSCLEDTDA